MAYTRGRCTNFDYCSIADSRRDVEVRVGDEFICPECGKPLKAPQVSGGGTNYVLPGIIGAGILILVGGAVFVGMRMGGSITQPAALAMRAAPPLQPAQTTAMQPGTQPGATQESALVRVAAPPQLSAGLAAQLASAYLTQIGDTDVKIEPGAAAGQLRATGLRGDRREAIVIDTSGATAGFAALGAHRADIVLSPRRIQAAEHDSLAAAGDMTSPGAEHLIGLGAFAVVVNGANAVPGLRRDQITGIFNGSIRNWSDLGGSSAPIDVYGQDKSTEEGAVFSALAEGGSDLAASARHLASSSQVAQAVTADPRGIGFVSLANVGQTRPVPVADTGATPIAATDRAAVAHEDYPFAYRVYLYTAPTGGTIAQHLADFAMSPAGQAVVEQQGFVSQTTKQAAAAPAPAPQTAAQAAAGSYKQFVAGAKKLAITFHFNPNSTDLDLKSTRDLDRVLNYLVSNHYAPDQLILVGFADNQGLPAQNIAVSKKRADAVAALFTARGVKPGKVAGFGAELEVADNATEEGREKNRRVEVYIKQ